MLFAVIIIDLIGFGIVVPILPYYAKSLNASPATLGLLLAAYPAFQFLFSPIWGRLSDRVGRKPVMLATILGSAGALTLLGISDSLLGLFAGRILGGVFGANISVATAYVADVSREDERTRWMAAAGCRPRRRRPACSCGRPPGRVRAGFRRSSCPARSGR